MTASKRIVVIMMCLTIGVVMARSRGSQQAGTQKASNTRQMRCVVRVTADTAAVPLSFDLLEAFLRSDAVADKAAQHAWNGGYGALDALFDVAPLTDGYQDESANPLLSADRNSPSMAPTEVVNPLPAGTRTVVFTLRVHLPDGVPPVAREFGNAMIENLRAALQSAFDAHSRDLQRQLGDARRQQEAARREFEAFAGRSTPARVEDIRLDSADAALYKQLEQVVDLSALTLQTPAREAFDLLRNSVQPPLNLVVLWRDLLENAQVDPTTPVEFDGASSVRLGAALDHMLDALSDPLAPSDDYRVEYIVDCGVIAVATRLGLPRKRTEIHVYDLPPLLQVSGQTSEIAALIRETIEPKSWFDSYPELGSGTIASSADGRLVVSQSHDVHGRIRELLTKLGSDFSVALPPEASRETLMERMEFLMSYRDQLEGELDRLQERQGQLNRERNEGEKQAIEDALRTTMRDLSTAIVELRAIHANAMKTEPHTTKTAGLQRTIQKIEQCLGHCGQTLSGLRDSPVMDATFFFVPSEWREEGTVASRIAAKQRDLRAVSRRIDNIQRVLAGAQAFDPESDGLLWAAKACEQANARVHDLKTRIIDLRPCTVTIIGGIEQTIAATDPAGKPANR